MASSEALLQAAEAGSGSGSLNDNGRDDAISPGASSFDGESESDAALAGVMDSPFCRRPRGRGYVPPPRKQQWYNAAFILMAELVGTGVLALPHTFAVIGLLPGAAVLVVFAGLSLYSGMLLYRLQTWFPHGITYGDMALACSNRLGQQVVFFFIYIAFFGNLAICILTCAETLQAVFYDWRHVCKWHYTVATALVLLPICQLRTLHHVSFVAAASAASIFASLAIILSATFTDTRDTESLGLLAVAVEGASLGLDLGEEGLGLGDLGEIGDFGDFAGGAYSNSDPDRDTDGGFSSVASPSFLEAMAATTTAIFAFGGQGLYFETIAEMKRPSDFPKAVSATTGLILLVYLIVSISCNAVYGGSVKGNVLHSLPDGAAKRAAGTLLFLHVCVSYALAQQIIGRAIHVRWRPDDVDTGSARERRQWLAISLLLLGVSFLVANGVPFFSQLLGIVAALSTVPLTFAIPALMVLRAAAFLPPLPPTVGPTGAGKPQFRVQWYERPVLYGFVVLSAFLFVGMVGNTVQLVHSWKHIGRPFACHSLG